jgi:hypothetical protein
MATSTERSRRLRRHRKGDHSLCLPERCDEATGDVAAPVATVADGPDLGVRGRRLWSQMTESDQLGPADLVLLEEGCRIADRLDRMDDLLRGREDAWFRFYSKADDGTVVRVVIDRALAEARQQADTLRGIVADLTKKVAAKVPEEREASGSDDLAKLRAERRKAAGL